DFIFVQITFSTDRLIRWRESIPYDGRMYAGVLVLASKRMAQRINASIPEIRIPERIIDKLDDDPDIGIDLACEQIDELRQSGAFDGVHLIPVGRYREMAKRLQEAPC
ncbi:MAG: methylenetetrahydrofolate reductase, partial [Actinomycetota bacterium]|nr:methylenetetrahydrofolate reductase [Actinomycetota bacterium]